MGGGDWLILFLIIVMYKVYYDFWSSIISLEELRLGRQIESTVKWWRFWAYVHFGQEKKCENETVMIFFRVAFMDVLSSRVALRMSGDDGDKNMYWWAFVCELSEFVWV